MTKLSMDVDWMRATTWGAVLGGVFWAVVVRFSVLKSGPSIGVLLSVAALISLVVISMGVLIYVRMLRRTLGIGMVLAPITGWIAIGIYGLF